MKNYIKISLLIVCAFVLVACQKPKISSESLLPNKNAITKISIEKSTESAKSVDISDLETIGIIYSNLKNSRGTDLQSVNDNPNSKEYYIIKIYTKENETVMYTYKNNNGRIYLEFPYQAIFSTIFDANDYLN